LTATEREGDVTRLGLVRDVSRAYYDLAQAQQRLALFGEVVDIVRRTRDSVRKQVEVGAIPAQDLIKAETELARAEGDVVRTQGETETARAVLNAVMGRPADTPLVAAEPLAFVPVALDQTILTVQATARRPELAAAGARIAAARDNVRLQRADYRPDLSVGLLQNTTLGSRDFLNPRETGVGVGLRFPLFDTGRIRGRVRQAEAEVREREAVQAQARLDVLREVGDAFARVRATETLVRRYDQDILPQSQDLLTKAQFGYERGGTTLLEYLEAQRTYRNTRAEYLDILGDNARARADLERAAAAGQAPNP
jgi:cobalt-zinc-cadmium efflux system outer membrane protein